MTRPPPPSDTQARVIWSALAWVSVAAIVVIAAALIWALGRLLDLLSPVLWPVAVAGVLACLLDPLVDGIQRRGLRRSVAITAVFCAGLLLVAGVFGSVVPQLVRETRELVERLPRYWENLQLRAEDLVRNPPPLLKRFLEHRPPSPPPTNSVSSSEPNSSIESAPATNAPPALTNSLDKETLQTATGWVTGALPMLGRWLFGTLGRVASGFGILVGLALVPVYAFYFLLEKQGISAGWRDYLPIRDSNVKDETIFVVEAINKYLVAFFRGQVLVALCDGLLYGIGFLLIGLPYAVVLGAAAMVLTIVPFLGAIIIFIAALLLALVQFGNLTHSLLVVAVFAVVQALEALVISPRIMGNKVGLHPLTIIIAVMTGTTLLGGLLGGILAIPFTAALKVLMFRYVWKRPA